MGRVTWAVIGSNALLSKVATATTGDRDGSTVQADRNPRPQPDSLGRAHLLVLRNQAGPARFPCRLFQGRTAGQRTLPLGHIRPGYRTGRARRTVAGRA